MTARDWEAVTYAYGVAEHLSRAGFEVHLGDPRRLKAFMDADSKNDERDSRSLAEVLRTNRFPTCFFPDPRLFQGWDILRRRLEKGEASTRIKNQVRALLARYSLRCQRAWTFGAERGLAWLQQEHCHVERDALVHQYVEELHLVEKQKNGLEGVLACVAGDMPQLRVLMGLEGVNLVTGLTILLEAGPVERFGKESTFRAYAGCAPAQHDSGSTRATGNRRHVNRRWKTAFSRTTETLIRSPRDNPVKAYYAKQRRKTAKKVQAKARARGKTARIVYGMLRKMKDCRFLDEGLVERKSQRVEVLATA